MNTLVRNTLRSIAAAALAASVAVGQPTSTNSISLQAKLDGVAAGPVNLLVKFYDTEMVGTGTQQGATVTLNSQPVTNGIVSLPISPIDPAVFNGSTRYMELTVNGAVMGPARTLVTSVPYAMAARGLSVSSDGKVGIGLSDPAAALHIRRDDGNPTQVGQGSIYLTGDGNDGSLLLGVNVDGPFLQAGMTNGELIINPAGGNVGIGLSGNPQAKLDVGGDIRLQGSSPEVFWSPFVNGTAITNWSLDAYPFSQDAFGLIARPVGFGPRAAFLVTPDGRIGFGMNELNDIPSGAQVTVRGTLSTNVLTITGGSDVAEPVAISPTEAVAKAQPGMVMVIDRERDGKLVPCSSAYDKAVAGVLSGANGLKPGMVLSAEGQLHAAAGDDTMPLAMTGRVWVLCDASRGAIRRGDSLTTSTTPGHAMVVGDESRRAGAVIGKAMTELAEGRGMVLVLVNLQ